MNIIQFPRVSEGDNHSEWSPEGRGLVSGFAIGLGLGVASWAAFLGYLIISWPS